MPPTLQILTYSATGAAFFVGRSAACALATATMPAAEPSRMLLMSVICDLQLMPLGVGSSHFRSGGPLNEPKNRSGQPPLPDFVGPLRFAPFEAYASIRPRPGISRSLPR